MHHFPFHIGDFAKDTARFDLTQVGVYVRLLMMYYDSEQPLPDNRELLEFSLGVRTKPEKAALTLVLKLCFTHDAGKKTYTQKRCEAEIASYEKNVIQARYANVCRHWDKVNPGIGKPSYESFAKEPDLYFDSDTGRVRKVASRNSLVLVSQSEDDPTLPLPESQPITNHQSPITNISPVVPKGTDTNGGKGPKAKALAEAIYALYPRKVAKGDALKAIEKALKKSGWTELEMQAAVRGYAAAVSRWSVHDQKTFVPYPATWFNKGQYEDDPSTWERSDSADSAPGFSAQKKEGGGGFEVPVTRGTAEPEGWKAAMLALWGEDWQLVYAAWDLVSPADQRQVRDWLKKKKGAGEE